MTPRLRLRDGVAVVVTSGVLLSLTACDTTAQFAPSLPSAAGHRVDDGELRFWTGTPCVGITRIRMTFDAATEDSVEVVWEAPEPGVEVEYVDLGDPDTRFEAAAPLPADFVWEEADQVSLLLTGEGARWSSVADIATIVEGSADHPDDTFFFRDEVGWLDTASVEEKNGEEFLTVCTPDPDRE